jgi:putative aldouronate transport system substrate-binding protein
VLYLPDIPNYTRTLVEAEKLLLPLGITDPTVGYVSPTAVRQGVVLNGAVRDGIRDIVAGRRPLGDWEQLVGDWRSGGGEQIRNEFQTALAAR